MKFNSGPFNSAEFDGSASLSATVGLTGVAAAGSVGALTSNLQLTLAAVQSVTAVGSLYARSDSTALLSGVSAAGSVGSLATHLQLTLASVQSQTGLGNLAVSTSSTVSLGSVESQTSLGSLSIVPDSTLALSGVSSAGQVGALGGSADLTLQGTAATGEVGLLAVSTSASEISLSGVASTCEVGELSALADQAPEQFGGLDGVSSGILIDFDRSYRQHGAVTLKGLSSTCGLGALRTEVGVEFKVKPLPPSIAKVLLKASTKVESAGLSLKGVGASLGLPPSPPLGQPQDLVDEELEELAMLVAML